MTEETVVTETPTEEVAKSEILSEEEVQEIVEGPKEEEVVLPSDETSFEMPEKFQGKSAEEIAKAYLELEKMKKSSEEEKGGDEVSQEEKSEDETKDEETSVVSDDELKSYVEEFLAEGDLSEESYKQLEEKGVTKDQIKEHMEFIQYKQEKALKQVLEPLEGGVEKFKEVALWAKENKTEEEVNAFNEALSKSSVEAQRILLKGLYKEYEESNTTSNEDVLHTNTPQSTPKGVYTTQEEFFKDIGSEEYKNNPKFRQAVEAKMARSDIF